MYVIYPLQPGYKTGLSASYFQNRFDGFIIYFSQENHPASLTIGWIVFGLSGLPMNGISCNNKEIMEAEKRWAYCQISMNLVIMGLEFWRLSGVRVLNFPLQQHEHETRVSKWIYCSVWESQSCKLLSKYHYFLNWYVLHRNSDFKPTQVFVHNFEMHCT